MTSSGERGARGAAIAGGAMLSTAFLFVAGHGARSVTLLAGLAIWTAAPFVALAALHAATGRRPPRHGGTIRVALWLLALLPPAIYGSVALRPAGERSALAFFVVPLASWALLVAIALFAALLRGGWRRLAQAAVTLGGLGLLAAAGMLALFSWEHRQETRLPEPTGPFGVGREVREWTDPDRVDPTTREARVRRELQIWIWYPADAATRAPAAAYVPDALRAAREELQGPILTRLLTRDLTRVHAHARADAAVATGRARWPVLLFAPGLGAPSTDYTTLAEELASHGYVVVSADRPSSTSLVLFADGRRVTANAVGHPDEIAPPADVERLTEALVRIWADDLAFQLDRLAAIDRDDPLGRFTGRLDLARVGVFGHSFGGAAAAELCRRDARCRAGADLDGRLFGDAARGGIERPFLFLVSDHRGEAGSDEISAQIDAVAARLPNRPARLDLPGARHFNFSDQALLKEPHLFRWLGAIGPADARATLAHAAGSLRAFFDRALTDPPERSAGAR